MYVRRLDLDRDVDVFNFDSVLKTTRRYLQSPGRPYMFIS